MTHWKQFKLGEISKVRGGKRLPKGAFLSSIPNEHPYIRVRDMGSKHLPVTNLEYVPNEVFPSIKSYIVDKHDVILSIVGSVGLISLVNEELDKASLTENCVKIIPNYSVLNNEFLYYFLTSSIGQNEIKNKIVGAVQPKLPIYNINDITITLPPLPTQTAIAEILSSLDDKIELNNAINKSLEDLAQTLFKQWFVDFDFPDENGQLYKSSGGEMVASELGMIPRGWAINRMDRLITVKYGKDHRSIPDGKIPVYGSGGIMRYGNKAIYNKVSILIPRKGTLNNIFFLQEPFWSVDTMFYTELSDEGIAKYVYYYFKALDLAAMNVGSAVPSMTTKVLNDLLIVKPLYNVLSKFNDAIESTFIMNNSLRDENKYLTIMRDTLLPKLISGKIRVSEANEDTKTAL